MILAAGAGTRFLGPDGRGASKLRALLPVGPGGSGRPVVAVAVGAAVAAGFDEVIVVVGEDDLLDVLPDEVTVVVNEDPGTGLAGSLAGALRLADVAGRDAVVVGLGDQPGIPAGAWRAVADATGRPMARAVYFGVPGHPVRLHRSVWARLPLEGDRGAAALLAGRPDLVELVPCEGDPSDVDTWEDLERWS